MHDTVLKALGRRPGVLLALMTLWWVLPLFAINLAAHAFPTSLRSHLLYLPVILICAAFSAAMGACRPVNDIWHAAGPWKRYFMLCTAYALQMAVTLIVVLTLDAYGLIGYYGGDPEGSIGMLFIPSVLLYFFTGMVAGSAIAVGRRMKSRKRHPPRDRGSR